LRLRRFFAKSFWASKEPKEPKEPEQNAGADPKKPWDFLKGWEQNFSEGYAEPPAPPVFLHDTEGGIDQLSEVKTPKTSL